MLHAEPFETHLLSAELCILFIYFLKGNCIGLEYHIILSKIHIIVIIKTKIIDQNKSCSNNFFLVHLVDAYILAVDLFKAQMRRSELPLQIDAAHFCDLSEFALH